MIFSFIELLLVHEMVLTTVSFWVNVLSDSEPLDQNLLWETFACATKEQIPWGMTDRPGTEIGLKVIIQYF